MRKKQSIQEENGKLQKQSQWINFRSFVIFLPSTPFWRLNLCSFFVPFCASARDRNPTKLLFFVHFGVQLCSAEKKRAYSLELKARKKNNFVQLLFSSFHCCNFQAVPLPHRIHNLLPPDDTVWCSRMEHKLGLDDQPMGMTADKRTTTAVYWYTEGNCRGNPQLFGG